MAHHRLQSGTAGVVFHLINRGVRRLRLLDHDGDYHACLSTLNEAQARIPVRLFAYCLMPNHFHLVASPARDGELSRFMHWFTATHSKRWHAWRKSTGSGSVYQGRYKSIPVQSDRHFLTLCLYVERNPVRAGLVRRADDWAWSSCGQRCNRGQFPRLADWPVARPENWSELLNSAEPKSTTDQVRTAIRRGQPLGEAGWVERTARSLQVMRSLRPSGRPREWTK